MTKEELVKVVCASVLKEQILLKTDMENSKKCGRTTLYKGGLYFLYDVNDVLLYIGKVGDTPKTSLYDRMIGHSSGCHKVVDKRWYPLVDHGKFHRIAGLTKKELFQIERLAISGMNHPVYNDKMDVVQSVVNAIAAKI